MVPNAPCGVESRGTGEAQKVGSGKFLMRRVELKDLKNTSSCLTFFIVPNAPCGVESFLELEPAVIPASFLMRRVELKDKRTIKRRLTAPGFLMRRVELKVGLK